MATLSSVIVPAKVLKGGKHKVRIALAHNGETRYIVTDITIDSAKEFKNGSIVRRPDAAFLNTRLRQLLLRYQKQIDTLDYVNGLTCSELIYYVKHGDEDRHRTLQSVFEEMIALSSAKESSKAAYRTAWSAISKRINTSMLVETLTHASVLALGKKLSTSHLSSGTVYNYMTVFKNVINYAKRCGYARYAVDPCARYSPPKPDIRQSWLTAEQIIAIRDLITPKPNLQLCRDLFMLSYYLGGINVVDLLKINFNEARKTLRYIRTKTETRSKSNKWVEFAIPDEAWAIINRYLLPDGSLNLSASRKRTNCHFFFYNNMPKLAEAVGLPSLIYYSARKSFSQHAFELGISTSVIDYILGHKLEQQGSSLYNYIYVSPMQASEAIRKVLDNLK